MLFFSLAINSLSAFSMIRLRCWRERLFPVLENNLLSLLSLFYTFLYDVKAKLGNSWLMTQQKEAFLPSI